jgi:bifunctional UDP-N-acetylglucosamine pyrophosphorylase/glucosamine-1-phosphate N-acetyltransferase
MVDPAATYIDTTVSLAADVTLFPGTILQGRTVIGQGVEIGPGCRLVDCNVGEHTTLEHTVARLSEIGADCVVGPYAALEPGAHIPSGTRTGPFYTAGADAALDG